MTFAWLGWLTITALLFTTIFFHTVCGVEWDGNHFDAWGHKVFRAQPAAERAGGTVDSTGMGDLEGVDNVPAVPLEDSQLRGKGRERESRI
jgi:hypothetical protein